MAECFKGPALLLHSALTPYILTVITCFPLFTQMYKETRVPEEGPLSAFHFHSTLHFGM